MKKKVINEEDKKILEYFEERDTVNILKKYENMDKWFDVTVDDNGDIIVWED